MKRKNMLTLLIIIHDKFDSIDFFIKLLNYYKKDLVDVFFYFDCSRSEVRKEYLDLLSEYNFYFQEKNMGKLKSIINATNFIKTPFFKIIDQDDSFSLDNIEKINSALMGISENKLVKHVGAKIFKNSKLYGQTLNVDEINQQIANGKDSRFMQQTNFDTIYPTKIINKMNDIEVTTQTFHNDVLLSNFCVGTGSDIFFLKEKFYIHFYRAGQTKEYSISRAEAIPELYLNYEIMQNSKHEFKFENILKNNIFYHKIYIYRFTKWYTRRQEKKHGARLYDQTILIIRKLKGVSNEK